MLRTILSSLAVLALAATGCSSKDNNTTTPDAKVFSDAPASTCTALTIGPEDHATNSTMSAQVWHGAVSTDLGGTSTVSFEFYSGIESSLTGALDLSAGNQNNYSTCAACIRLVTVDSTGALVKEYFQDGGTLNLTVDPLLAQHLTGTATDVSLIEVTIDSTSFVSTPVVGGTCLSLGATVALDAGPVPLAWTCAQAAYNDGTTCDCGCAVHDPDCDLAAPTLAGCAPTGQVCGGNDVCVDTCHVLAPTMGCTTGTCGFENATTDICYTDPAAVSAVAVGATCAAGPIFCGVTNTIATGICDTFAGDDEKCRKACGGAADCLGTEVCAPIVGTRGLCVAKPANDTCQTAATITLGTAINGSTAGGVSNYNAGLEAATCTGFAQPGADVAYKVTLTANQTITATLSNVTPDFDPSLSLVGPGAAATVCTAAITTCTKGADANAAGAGETFTATVAAAGTYYIIVDSFSSSQTGGFTLTVN
ncbi:MAG: hypothetical protein ABI591_25155 [Kofleriaceae bacterium]